MANKGLHPVRVIPEKYLVPAGDLLQVVDARNLVRDFALGFHGALAILKATPADTPLHAGEIFKLLVPLETVVDCALCELDEAVGEIHK